MIESLETRRFMSVTAYQDGGIVYVRGTAGADDISAFEVAPGVTDEFGNEIPAGTVSILAFSDDGSEFLQNFSNVDAVIIDARDGDDRVTTVGYSLPYIVSGGAGNDEINVNDGDFIFPSTATSAVSGGAGNDTINIYFGTGTLATGDGGDDVLSGAEFAGSAVLVGGAGNDTFRASNSVIADGGNGSDTLFALPGSTVLYFGGNGNDTLEAFAGSVVTFFGQNGADTANVFSGASVTFEGGNGNDTTNNL